ncbi:unnamed protein product [Prorocentrum cordatum]|uniref:Uncharacterized protein n=1 Tax=Prorocentrum cordatum TaxID=2364126 RepID=A0ABN9SV43_9DINO|nr:unnamed protein product [Polarella glacialis]
MYMALASAPEHLARQRTEIFTKELHARAPCRLGAEPTRTEEGSERAGCGFTRPFEKGTLWTATAPQCTAGLPPPDDPAASPAEHAPRGAPCCAAQ